MSKPIKKYILSELFVGMTAEIEELITPELVDDFASLSGDFSTLHMEEKFAKERGFKTRVAHGVLQASFISKVVGMMLPGENALLHSISMQYRHPVYVGDTILIKGTLDFISEEQKAIVIVFEISNKLDNTVVATSKVQVGVMP